MTGLATLTPQPYRVRGRRDVGTRERIMREAVHLFVERGYHGLSMRELAQAVGVTKPALYHHYADKEALFLAIMEEALSGLRLALERSRRPASLREQLRVLIRELLSSAPQQRLGLQLAGELKHVSPSRRQNFEQHYREVWTGGLGQLLAQATERGELRPDIAVPVITGALLGMLYALVSRPPADSERAAAQLLDLFLDGAGA